MNREVKIAGRPVSESSPVFIVAELSANHNHDLKTALDTVSTAAECGADAIKIQTYTPDTITIDSDKECFRLKQGTIWDGRTLYDLYKEAYTPWEWHADLKARAKKEGILFFSTPFDNTAVDYLDELDVPAYKIASFEITDIPLISYAASKKKPMIISTGIALPGEIEGAVEACRKLGNEDVILLKCTSEYPADFSNMNLRTIPDMKDRFRVPVGLSDHSEGIASSVAAVALGACVVEKHFILDKSVSGPDAVFSLTPDMLRLLVESIREAEAAMGEVTYELNPASRKSREFSRSLFVVKDMQKGEKFTKENLRSIRPGFGLSPKYIDDILGRQAASDIERGTSLSYDMIGGD